MTIRQAVVLTLEFPSLVGAVPLLHETLDVLGEDPIVGQDLVNVNVVVLGGVGLSGEGNSAEGQHQESHHLHAVSNAVA